MLNFISCITGKDSDLNDFECSMIVGAKQAGLSIILRTVNLLGFLCTVISGVYKEWSEKEKKNSKQQFCDQKSLLMKKLE